MMRRWTTKRDMDEKSKEDTEDCLIQPNGEVVKPKRIKKRGSGLVMKAKYRNKCLTCERPGHHWRDCTQLCTHHQKQGKSARHNGRECPLEHRLYKKAGSMAQSRAQFESSTRAKLVLEAERAKAREEVETRAKEWVIYEEGVKAGADRAWEETLRRNHEAIPQGVSAQHAAGSTPNSHFCLINSANLP